MNVLQLDPEKGLPSDLAIADTVHTLARYASICLSERLVPIVEPEVMPNGTHDLACCAKMTDTGVGLSVRSDCLAPRLCGRRRPHGKHGQSWLGGPMWCQIWWQHTMCRPCLRTVPPAMPGIFVSGDTVLDEDNEETAAISLMR